MKAGLSTWARTGRTSSSPSSGAAWPRQRELITVCCVLTVDINKLSWTAMASMSCHPCLPVDVDDVVVVLVLVSGARWVDRREIASYCWMRTRVWGSGLSLSFVFPLEDSEQTVTIPSVVRGDDGNNNRFLTRHWMMLLLSHFEPSCFVGINFALKESNHSHHIFAWEIFLLKKALSYKDDLALNAVSCWLFASYKRLIASIFILVQK